MPWFCYFERYERPTWSMSEKAKIRMKNSFNVNRLFWKDGKGLNAKYNVGYNVLEKKKINSVSWAVATIKHLQRATFNCSLCTWSLFIRVIRLNTQYPIMHWFILRHLTKTRKQRKQTVGKINVSESTGCQYFWTWQLL